jgi:hypothetical protein
MVLTVASCDKDIDYNLESSWDVPDYTSGEVQSGMSAYDLFVEALENYEAAENFVYMRSFEFDAGAIGTQQSMEVTKFSGDEAFYEVTKQGTSLGKVNYGNRFYSDGTTMHEIPSADRDSETKFPSLGNADWSGLEYGDYEGDMTLSEKYVDLKKFSDYVITRDTLSDSHDDKVYEYNDKYYICITIDCMGIEEGTTQLAVEDAIMDGLGDKAVAGSFEWEGDTKIYMEITMVEDEPYITAKNMREFYKAVQAILPVSCQQVTSGTYSYNPEDCVITDLEKMNLAAQTASGVN